MRKEEQRPGRIVEQVCGVCVWIIDVQCFMAVDCQGQKGIWSSFKLSKRTMCTYVNLAASNFSCTNVSGMLWDQTDGAAK